MKPIVLFICQPQKKTKYLNEQIIEQPHDSFSNVRFKMKIVLAYAHTTWIPPAIVF